MCHQQQNITSERWSSSFLSHPDKNPILLESGEQGRGEGREKRYTLHLRSFRMPVSSFATILRVTPAPSTISESRAVLQHLNKHHGKVTTFFHARDGLGKGEHGEVTTFSHARDGLREDEHGDDGTTASTFYALFARSPSSSTDGGDVETRFSISANHDIPSAAALDPFNIRGLRSRKPHPPPRDFTCTMTRVSPKEQSRIVQEILSSNSYVNSFEIDTIGNENRTTSKTLMLLGLSKSLATNLAPTKTLSEDKEVRSQVQQRKEEMRRDKIHHQQRLSEEKEVQSQVQQRKEEMRQDNIHDQQQASSRLQQEEEMTTPEKGATSQKRPPSTSAAPTESRRWRLDSLLAMQSGSS